MLLRVLCFLEVGRRDHRGRVISFSIWRAENITTFFDELWNEWKRVCRMSKKSGMSEIFIPRPLQPNLYDFHVSVFEVRLTVLICLRYSPGLHMSSKLETRAIRLRCFLILEVETGERTWREAAAISRRKDIGSVATAFGTRERKM